jgi:histidine triad (HIT) family protein
MFLYPLTFCFYQKGAAIMDCIFCKIVSGEIPSAKVYEDDRILCYKDINPQAPVHVIVIPKEHITGAAAITDQNAEIVAYIFSKIPGIAKTLGIFDSGFRVITNSGADACQSVPHLHFHVLGGKKLADKMA